MVFQLFHNELVSIVIGWILTNKHSQENSSKKQGLPPIFDTEHANKLQEFEWSVVQNNTSAPKEDSPTWRMVSTSTSGFANAEKRLFGTDNYEFYIRTIQGISGNHEIWCTDTKGPKDFLLGQTKSGVAPTMTPISTY
jgi:hypothetical protein